MAELYTYIRPLIYCIPPEIAHNLGLWALRTGVLASPEQVFRDELAQAVWGLSFANPVGLAAGFDKNAVAIDALLRQGFGFVEAGTVTPKPQPGNPKPRIFRLREDRAVINRLGFNNEGLEPYLKRFAQRNVQLGVAGANIGKNKDSQDAVADYATGLRAVYPLADYVTVNISSPNTQGLRALQEKNALNELLHALVEVRASCIGEYGRSVPLLLKVAPDLDAQAIDDVVSVVLEQGIDGLIVSNTTISRPESLKNMHKKEQGGLSGAPLMAMSTSVLSIFYNLTQGRVPLVGVGGVSSARDAYAKIRAGASLVQLYTGLVYEGFRLVQRINDGLVDLLARDGFSNISQAVGADHRR
jgi:dihydroorotate dehydrogenase